ncbi:MAG: RHS repeat protein, partial [bacterium]|nr:RHS repeat protein [bacterium]
YTIGPKGDGWRWTDKHGRWKDYDSEGRFVAEGKRSGETERLLYTADGKLEGYADGDRNQVFWFEYNPGNGLLSAIRDAQDRQLTLQYHPDGRLWKVIDERGRESRYDYDAEGRLQDVFKPDGKESHVGYNEAGQAMSVTDETGSGFEFDYDYDERAEEYYSMVKDPEGNVKEVWYDEQGRPKRVDYNGVTKQLLEREDNALIVTDEDGNVTRKEYDEWNNLKRVVYPSGKETLLEYEHIRQRLTKRVSSDGTVDRYIYDDEQRTERRILAEGTAEEKMLVFSYRSDGSQESFTETVSATGETEEITYTRFGKQKSLKNEHGEWIYHYNEQQEFEYVIGTDGSRYPPE